MIEPAGRRPLGAAGLVAVLLAGVIVAVAGKHYPGRPVAAPVAGPPAVDDCVLEPLGSTSDPLSVDIAMISGSAYTFPALTTGPCSGPRYGEVTDVITDPATPVVAIDRVDDPNADRCLRATSHHLGIEPWSTDQGTALHPVLQSATALIGPSERQQAAGQHWLACATYLPVRNFSTGVDDAALMASQERYEVSLRNAVSTGAGRDRLALCVDGPINAGNTQPDCTTPHTGEILGMGSTGLHPASRHAVTMICQQLAARQTRIPATTFGLTVELVAADSADGSVITADPIPPDSLLTCGITVGADRRLGGSLLALGDAPVPWAG